LTQFNINHFNPFLPLVKIPYVEKSIADLVTKMKKKGKYLSGNEANYHFAIQTLNFT
jgi:hypothetical protein